MTRISRLSTGDSRLLSSWRTSVRVAARRSSILALLGAVGLCGCQPSNGGGSSGSTAKADVRAAHAVPGLPTFDICWDGRVVITGVEYGEITDYASLTARSARIFAIVPGDTCDNPVSATVNTAFAVDRDYTVVFLEEAGPLQVLDDNSRTATGKARLRLINASPDATPLSVDERDGATILAAIAFDNAMDYRTYREIDAGLHNFSIRSEATNEVFFELNGATLAEGGVYTLYATGNINGPTPFDVALVEDARPGTTN